MGIEDSIHSDRYLDQNNMSINEDFLKDSFTSMRGKNFMDADLSGEFL